MITRVTVVGLFALSLMMVVITPWCTRDRATTQDYVDAITATAVRPGETALVHPPWRDDVTRAAPGTTAALAPRSGDPLDALVIFKDRGGVPLPDRIASHVVSREVHGGIEILRTGRGQAPAPGIGVIDFSERLAQARVSVDDVRCAWSSAKRRHVCEGLPEWMYVGVQDLPVGGALQRCVWAHPRTGATLRIELPGAPLLDELILDLAITDPAADNASAAEVRAQLFVDDRMMSLLVRDPGKRGFVTSRVKTHSGSGTVRLDITTPHDGQRHTCFRLTAEAKR